MTYRVVIYSLDDPNTAIVVSKSEDEKFAKSVLSNFVKAKWDMDRRPGIGVIDKIIIKVDVVTDLGFAAQIFNDLENMPSRLKFPDNTNTGKKLAALAIWKKVADIGEKKYETLLKNLVEEGLVKDPKSFTTPGEFQAAKGGSITVDVKVNNPRREFNFDFFANVLLTHHNVPVVATRAYMEDAKQPGATQARQIIVKDKGIKI